MATQTTNYGFQKPDDDDFYDIQVQNGNWDRADEKLKGLEEGKVSSNGGDISETRVKTLEAPQEEFPVPQAGEGAKTFFGKVKKSLEDWKNFKDGIITLGKLVNNGQCTEPGFALDARYGKTLEEKLAACNVNYEQLNSNFAAEFTAAVIQDLNSPTMAINSYLNNVSNPPNGYQTGGKVISVMDSNGELGAQLSLTRGYSHPQYRYKDNNGWSAWKDITLASDFEIKILDVECAAGETVDNRLNAYQHIITGMASLNHNSYITKYLLTYNELIITSTTTHTVRVYYIEL